MRPRTRIGLIVAAVALGVLVYAGLVYAARGYYLVTAPPGSVFSGAADGARVWYDYLAALGLKPRIMQQFDQLPATDSTIVMVGPLPRRPSSAESAALFAWVAHGGRLVLVGTDLPSLGGLATAASSTDGVVTGAGPGPGGTDFVAPIMPAPFADGVATLTVGPGRILADGPDWVTHFKDMRGQVVISRAAGAGEVVWLADPHPIANAGIGQADNARFATILAARGGTVYFDEYHHGYVSGGGLWDRLGDGGRVAVLLAAAALVVALFSAARRLGPPVPELAPPAAHTTEWLGPLAELFRKAGARADALRTLAEGLRRSLAQRYGSLAAGVAAHPEAASAIADADAACSAADPPSRERFIGIARRLVRARQEVERR